ncbi:MULTISPECIES: hypothetical protein [unclassified Stenotrophomonas]|jgi:hypothetical protein|uniref:hypothetical protein n=1 Tax=unclassified Stenotrophomonas TaxID=196198 RepID=UPI0034666522
MTTPSLVLPFLLLLSASMPASAAAALPPSQAASRASMENAAVVVSRVTPTSVSVFDGALQGEVEGNISSQEAVNLFAYSAVGARMKLSLGRLAPGYFRHPSMVALNDIVVDGSAVFFVSPSEDGSYQPSAPFVMQPQIVLPAPRITAAVGGRGSARIHGTALRGARINVEVAGQRRAIMANGHTGDWSVEFTGLGEGQHEVLARVYDLMGTFPDSTPARATVAAEGDILRPLQVTSPPEGFPIQRTVDVRGVASPGRGNVQVALGGGATVEAPVSATHHGWSARVTSATHGSVPLQVALPGTGEQVVYNVDVAYFGDPVVNRFRQYTTFQPSYTRTLDAEGTVTLSGPDTVVRYLSVEQTWKTLAHVQEDGHWHYVGPVPDDMYLQGEFIEGKGYPQVGRLNVPSLGDHPTDRVTVPLLAGAPRMTSPARVGQTATLSGEDLSGTLRPIKVTLPDGRSFTAPVDDAQRWSIHIEGLPLGRIPVVFAKDVPDQIAHQYAASHEVLDVVEVP